MKSQENDSIDISIDDYKGMSANDLIHLIITEHKIITGDDLVKLFDITFSEKALFKPDWVEAIYGYRAWLLIGEEGYYSAVVYDAGNGWYGIQSVFPTIGVDLDFCNEQGYPKRTNKQDN